MIKDDESKLKSNQYQHPFHINKYDIGNGNHMERKIQNLSNNIKTRKINRSTNIQRGSEADYDGGGNSSKALKKNYPGTSSSNGELKKFIHYQMSSNQTQKKGGE
jgi:hypothetical protein